MYETQTSQVILQRMLDNINSPIYKGEGSLIYDALSPAANEIAQRFMDLDSLLLIPFVQTSYGDYLDKIGNAFGEPRKLASKATGEVTFEGTEETFIVSGTLIATQVGYQYTTNSDVSIVNGTATVSITAVNAGKDYNMPVNAINKLPISINGITKVYNQKDINGGTEDEDDDSYKARILLKAQTPATSGNEYHYKQWALEVSDVGDAKVIPVWNGPGTVKVVVIDSNKKGVSQTIVDSCKSHIEEERPIGADVTVISAEELPINISITLSLQDNFDLNTVINNIAASITSYLASIAFKQDYVSYARIGGLILAINGVADYTNFKINNGTSNITIRDEQVAVLGGVTNV